MITGQCHCGTIRYEAQLPVIKTSQCDCRGCQRATGTLTAPFVTVKRAGFRLTAGTPTEFRAASGDRCDAHGTWNFCPHCGAHLFWKSNDSDAPDLDLFAGSLDDTSLFQPKE